MDSGNRPMDQLNIFRGVAHFCNVPNIVQIPAAAYADNLSTDPVVSAGHGVYLRAERQPSGDDSGSAQT